MAETTTTRPSEDEGVAHWAALYETDDLISAKSFDFRRTALSCLDLAISLAEAEAGFLATFDKGRELELKAARGVDEEGILEDPRLTKLYEQAVEVEERVMANGKILAEPDPEAVRAQLQAAYDDGIRAAAIAFLHGYRFTARRSPLVPVGTLLYGEKGY